MSVRCQVPLVPPLDSVKMCLQSNYDVTSSHPIPAPFVDKSCFGRIRSRSHLSPSNWHLAKWMLSTVLTGLGLAAKE